MTATSAGDPPLTPAVFAGPLYYESSTLGATHWTRRFFTLTPTHLLATRTEKSTRLKVRIGPITSHFVLQEARERNVRLCFKLTCQTGRVRKGRVKTHFFKCDTQLGMRKWMRNIRGVIAGLDHRKRPSHGHGGHSGHTPHSHGSDSATTSGISGGGFGDSILSGSESSGGGISSISSDALTSSVGTFLSTYFGEPEVRTLLGVGVARSASSGSDLSWDWDSVRRFGCRYYDRTGGLFPVWREGHLVLLRSFCVFVSDVMRKTVKVVMNMTGNSGIGSGSSPVKTVRSSSMNDSLRVKSVEMTSTSPDEGQGQGDQMLLVFFVDPNDVVSKDPEHRRFKFTSFTSPREEADVSELISREYSHLKILNVEMETAKQFQELVPFYSEFARQTKLISKYKGKKDLDAFGQRFGDLLKRAERQEMVRNGEASHLDALHSTSDSERVYLSPMYRPHHDRDLDAESIFDLAPTSLSSSGVNPSSLRMRKKFSRFQLESIEISLKFLSHFESLQNFGLTYLTNLGLFHDGHRRGWTYDRKKISLFEPPNGRSWDEEEGENAGECWVAEDMREDAPRGLLQKNFRWFVQFEDVKRIFVSHSYSRIRLVLISGESFLLYLKDDPDEEEEEAGEEESWMDIRRLRPRKIAKFKLQLILGTIYNLFVNPTQSRYDAAKFGVIPPRSQTNYQTNLPAFNDLCLLQCNEKKIETMAGFFFVVDRYRVPIKRDFFGPPLPVSEFSPIVYDPQRLSPPQPLSAAKSGREISKRIRRGVREASIRALPDEDEHWVPIREFECCYLCANSISPIPVELQMKQNVMLLGNQFRADIVDRTSKAILHWMDLGDVLCAERSQRFPDNMFHINFRNDRRWTFYCDEPSEAVQFVGKLQFQQKQFICQQKQSRRQERRKRRKKRRRDRE